MGGGWAFFRQVCIFEVVSALRLKQPNTIELGGMLGLIPRGLKISIE